MSDKDRIKLLKLVIIVSQVAWAGVLYNVMKDYSELYPRYEGMTALAKLLMDHADLEAAGQDIAVYKEFKEIVDRI